MDRAGWGRRLRTARELKGFKTKAAFAKAIVAAARAAGLASGCDRQRVWKWEEHDVVPSLESQLLMADVLCVPHEVVHSLGWPHWLPEPSTEELTSDMRRRNALAVLGLTAVSSLMPSKPARAAAQPSIGQDSLEWLEGVTNRLITLPTIERQHMVPMLDASLATARNLLNSGTYSNSTGVRLNLVAAQLAQTCGWNRFDNGHHEQAAELWNEALDFTAGAGNMDLAANVAADLAYQKMWTGDPASAATILEKLLAKPAHPVVRSLVHLRKARAHAMMGDRTLTYAHMRASERDLSRAQGDDAPRWAGWMSESDLLIDSGRCELDLGHPKVALQRIDEGLAALPAARDKTRAIFWVYEAQTLVAAGEYEQGAAKAASALDIAETIGSTRCLDLVRELAPALKAAPKAPGVAELMERVRV